MKKTLKVMIASVLAVAFLFSAAGCSPTKNATNVKKTIDLYLIAGQSNAVGTTKMVNDSTGLTDPFILELTESDKRVTEGFANVLYAGDSQSGSGVTYHNKREWAPVTLGAGKTSNHLGAEIGMALSLSDQYTETNAMGIIKLAHGGTNLLDVLQGENFPEGNWAPPVVS